MKRNWWAFLVAAAMAVQMCSGIGFAVEDANNTGGQQDEAVVVKESEDVAVSAEAVAEAEATKANGKADIVFVIDSTGSMSNEISNVKANLNKFTEVLDEAELNFRIAVVEYKDITESGEEESTKILENNGDTWFTTAEEVASTLDKIKVEGGGDTPETLIDALGCMLSSSLSFRVDASKFAIVLTDANYKTDNNYGYEGMSDMIAALKETGVSTSVISSTSYESTYSDLYNETDGIFCNINGDFAEELVKLASYVESVVNPVTITLSSEEGEVSGDKVNYTLTAKITSSDEELTAENLLVTLTLPEGLTSLDPVEQTIDELGPGDSKTIIWNVQVPVLTEDANYTYSVNVDCDDFATGVVCVAQDSFSVIGSGAEDYRYVFGEDNYAFFNSYGAFGSGEIYITDEDLAAYLDNLKNTEISFTANRCASDGTVASLLSNDLKDWAGSCYGMSLTSALFKTGILDVSDWGADVVYNIPFSISASTGENNSKLESFINIYQISQYTDIGLQYELEEIGSKDFPSVMRTMWDKASNIGVFGAKQQPYLVRLIGNNGGHAVVCYGAESGSYTVNDTKYDKRLLVYDPNSSDTEYVYINKDFSDALFSNGYGYSMFGYRMATLSELNSYSYEDSECNYKAKLMAEQMSEYTLSTKTKSAVIIANEVVSGDLNVDFYQTEETVLDGEPTDNNVAVILPDANESYTITPANGESVNAELIFEDYALSVNSDADSAFYNPNGTVEINNAKGTTEIRVAANDSAFDFVTVSGEANGDVQVGFVDGQLMISGDLSDYTVSNMDIEKNEDSLTVPDDTDISVSLDDENQLDPYYDPDGDGAYDTEYDPEKSHTHTYSNPTFTWSDDNTCKATFTCKDGDDEQTLDCTVTEKTEGNQTTYTATVEFEGKTYTDTKTVTNRVPITPVKPENLFRNWWDWLKKFL